MNDEEFGVRKLAPGQDPGCREEPARALEASNVPAERDGAGACEPSAHRRWPLVRPLHRERLVAAQRVRPSH
jgi:hypothetical protein